jgi:SAM-dependent methyltransferase
MLLCKQCGRKPVILESGFCDECSSKQRLVAQRPPATGNDIFHDINKFIDYILSFQIFQEPAEAQEYIETHYKRFLKTLEKIPHGRGKLLEIGAAPFCMTLMIRACREFDLEVINYGSEADIVLASDKYGERVVVPCRGPNVECDPFPYGTAEFDVVVCAEVIEHLTFNPSHMLCEIHRILKSDGVLVLTTPNVLRLFYNYQNARRVIQGQNIYDPYSGYGPYGRHNREFTPGELRKLVEGCGFEISELEVCDLDTVFRGRLDSCYRWLLAMLFGVDRQMLRQFRGSQMILTARPHGQRQTFLPQNLYKSVHALEKAKAVFPHIP